MLCEEPDLAQVRRIELPRPDRLGQALALWGCRHMFPARPATAPECNSILNNQLRFAHSTDREGTHLPPCLVLVATYSDFRPVGSAPMTRSLPLSRFRTAA